MAFVNLPPNFQDMFGSLNDRISKLETGPNQAMYTAEAADVAATSAQSTATQAQIQAINAELTALNASAQATSAQATASIASSQATYAVQSADGKNTIYYGGGNTPGVATITSILAGADYTQYYCINGFAVGDVVTVTGVTPSVYNTTATITVCSATSFTIAGRLYGPYSSGGTATVGITTPINGDVYYKINGSNQVVQQYIYTNGAWTPSPITNTVIANLDAGKITTGTLSAIQISAGSGNQAFYVSSTGYMQCSGASVQGIINADSGIFTGSIRANAGYFGTGTGDTLTNGWSIGSTGLIGVGTGNISGGAISGTSITTTTGRIGGWYLGSNYLSSVNGALTGYYIQTTGNASFATVNASGFQMNSAGALTMGGGTISGATTISSTSTIATDANIAAGTSVTAGTSITATGTLTGGSLVASNLTGTTTTTSAQANCYVNTGGGFQKTSNSSLRYKENITDINNVPGLDPKALLDIPVVAFTYKAPYLDSADDRFDQMVPGFIAEDVDRLYPIAADYTDGNVETWNERFLIPGLLALIQDQEARIKALEAKMQ